MSALFCRTDLRAEGLLRTARRVFAAIPDEPGNDIALVDHLMSGLAPVRPEVSFAAAVRAGLPRGDDTGERRGALRDRAGAERHALV